MMKFLRMFLLLLIAAALLIPFIWMVYSALPIPHTYITVLDRFNFLLYARNSLLIAALTVFGSTLSSALVAYGFARIPFRGNKILFALMLATMMIPFPVIMTTLFLIFRSLSDFTGIQFLGTFRPLWLPAFFGSAFNIFLLRQFFLTIPEELSEAARLDGCSELGIFFRVVLPLSKPALAVVALFSFMNAWNDFLAPLVYLQHPDQYTLSLALHALQSQHGGTPQNLLMAAATLTLLPVVILFLMVQRTFIEGIATTGMKG